MEMNYKEVNGDAGNSSLHGLKQKKGRPQCLVCGKVISDRRNLVRHLRRIHCIEPTVRKPRLRCSYSDNCTYLCATSELLRDHLQTVHDFSIVRKMLNFKSRADFEKWKQEEEVNTNARYVAYTGTKSRGSKKVYYLKCHRSGNIRCENSKERKRSKPTKGYTQCGSTCPSSIKLVESINGSIQVIYYPDHLGHTLDDESVQYMKLSSQEKEEIVGGHNLKPYALGKLANGQPVGKIVTDARKRKGSKLSRINLLQRRDVYNLKKNIKYLEKEEDQDGKKIDNWIKRLGIHKAQNSPVAFYCPIGKSKDYTLIIIHNIQKIIYSIIFDGSIVYVKTKRGKANVDFNLIAVNVICENGDGYPIAFCISHKTEYITFDTFFKIIYQNFGTIKAQIFVSDNNSQLYLAWKNIMGDCESKLMCTFDIELYWEQKLTSLKCPVYKQKEISRQLKLLLNEQDQNVFEADLLQHLKMWEDDKDARLFGNFFQKFFAKRRFEWATCYRIHSERKESINKYLEPINAVLESIYVESYCSLENSLNYLFAFIRDVCLLKLLKWDEQIVIEKLRETEKKHAEKFDVKKVDPSGTEWTVLDGNNSSYIVRTSRTDCDKKCGVFCDICNICTHGYTCTCNDYVTDFNICRHVHAVVTSVLEQSNIAPKNSSTTPSKSIAVSMAKSLAFDLSNSNLTEVAYMRIIKILSNIRDDFEQGELEKRILLKSDVLKIELVSREHSLNSESEMPLKIVKNSSEDKSHSCNVSNVIYHADLVITGSDDGKIKVWTPDLLFVSEMEAPAGILSMAACDTTLFTCATDGNIQTWDLLSGKNSGTIPSNLFQPQKLFVDKSSKVLWAGDSQGNVAKYMGGIETCKFELIEEIWDLMAVATSIYTGRDRDVVVAELIEGSQKPRVAIKATFEGRSPLCLVGNNFCFLNRDGRNIQVHKNSVEDKFPKIKDLVASDLIINALASDGDKCVYSGGYDSTVKKWDLHNSNCLGSINLGCCINALASKSESECYVARSDGLVTKIGI